MSGALGLRLRPLNGALAGLIKKEQNKRHDCPKSEQHSKNK